MTVALSALTTRRSMIPRTTAPPRASAKGTPGGEPLPTRGARGERGCLRAAPGLPHAPPQRLRRHRVTAAPASGGPGAPELADGTCVPRQAVESEVRGRAIRYCRRPPGHRAPLENDPGSFSGEARESSASAPRRRCQRHRSDSSPSRARPMAPRFSRRRSKWERARHCLLQGIDPLDFLREQEDAFRAYEASH